MTTGSAKCSANRRIFWQASGDQRDPPTISSGRAASFKADTALLGSVPELDSMAVISVITGLEDRFGIMIDDDDIDGDTFATVGSLVEFVRGKVGA